MSGLLAVYKRELKTFFQSPSTWIVMALLFFLTSIIFVRVLYEFSAQSQMAGQGGMFGMAPSRAPNLTQFVVAQMFGVLTSLILFTVPLLTMRLIAEERSEGTFELMVTNPIGDWSILLGKYFALLTVGLAIVAVSAIYPVLTWWLGRENQVSPEWPVVISCWIGLLLIFAAYGAFGLMSSAFTENQITAGIITLIGLILWNIANVFSFEGFPRVQAVLTEISAQQHTENFIRGVLMLKDFTFYILASFLFLFIASKVLEARRWRV